jgi:exopolysaccharide biosynthesis polyprenyl glycosylphosphotransferase
MALPHAIRTPIDWQLDAPPRRAPLGAIVPVTDAAALFAATLFLSGASLRTLSYAVITFTVLLGAGSNRTRINPRLSEDLPALLGRLAAPLLVIALLLPAEPELGQLLRIAPWAAALVLLGRTLTYKLIRDARAHGYIFEPTLIVGAGSVGVNVATTLQEHPEFGLYPIGFLDSFDDEGLPLPILGDVRQLEAVIREFSVQRIVVAFGAIREPEMVSIIRACDRVPVEVHVVPRFFELGVSPSAGASVDDLWGIPIVRLRRSALRTVAWRTKRAFDLAIATVLVTLCSPVLLASALAVRLTGRGPIFFRQTRIGQRGEFFQMLKFRTMRENADSDTTWSVGDDLRRTMVGRFLRVTSLDELPQLFNVLKGEMSLVGPRPERPFFVDQFRVAVPGYDDRHRVPAGMTGWAQVHGLRGDTSIPDRAKFDNHYVENWSLWRDIVILFRTVGSVLLGEGR